MKIEKKPNKGKGRENLRPPPNKEEAQARGKKGGVASGLARRERKSAKEILAMIDGLKVTDNTLSELGIPESEQNQKVLRMVALHQSALSGKVDAQRLLLELDGEMPDKKVDVAIRQPNSELQEILDCLQDSEVNDSE
ncbi:MAG: hypothetical protein FWD76_06240 [Firmicutes bacterium]|nr:hypothetical protein [Bacillota bacterium]